MTAENGSGRPQTLRDWFGRVADQARELVRERVEEAALRAAQIAHEELERVLAKAEGRLRRGAVYAGAMASGVALVVVGLAGAVGELLGRAWLGQLAVGFTVLVVAVVWLTLASRAAKRRAAEEAARAAAAGAAREAARPTVASAGAAGWLAGMLLAQRRQKPED